MNKETYEKAQKLQSEIKKANEHKKAMLDRKEKNAKLHFHHQHFNESYSELLDDFINHEEVMILYMMRLDAHIAKLEKEFDELK